MAVNPFCSPRFRAFDANGEPLAGGLLYTYAAGTTTPQATYTTRDGGVANANPVVLDANGEADVWTTPGTDYKFVLKNSADVTQWTEDNVPSPTTSDTLQDGTVNSPSLAFSSDADTGLYRIGTNRLGVTVGAVGVVDAVSTGVAFPRGLTATQSQGDTTALTATGNGTAPGGTFTGGATGGAGLSATGGASGGAGGTFTGGAGDGHGLVAAGNGTGNALQVGAGNVKFTGSNPAATTGLTNTLTPANFEKASARITTNGSGGVTIVDGFNVSSVALLGATILELTLASAMADTNYRIQVTFEEGPAYYYPGLVYANSTTTIRITLASDPATPVDLSGQACKLFVSVFGKQ